MKKDLTFKLVELREVVNVEGKTSIMLKLFCESFIKSVTTLGDFNQPNEGRLTYYMFVNKIPVDDKGKPKYELGEQDGSKEYVIEHYYEGAGVWKPVNYNAVERDIIVSVDGKEVKMRVKHLKAA